MRKKDNKAEEEKKEKPKAAYASQEEVKESGAAKPSTLPLPTAKPMARK